MLWPARKPPCLRSVAAGLSWRVGVCLFVISTAPPCWSEEPPAAQRVAVAKAKAKLLHETIHGALQVVHRDFFDEEESVTIPSRSLEDVFSELEKSFQVEVRWVAVNTEAMNIDNRAKTDFQKKAVKAMLAGQAEFEMVDDQFFRHAGTIKLSSRCLKCHAPARTDTNDRVAGLVISIPLKPFVRKSP